MCRPLQPKVLTERPDPNNWWFCLSGKVTASTGPQAPTIECESYVQDADCYFLLWEFRMCGSKHYGSAGDHTKMSCAANARRVLSHRYLPILFAMMLFVTCSCGQADTKPKQASP